MSIIYVNEIDKLDQVAEDLLEYEKLFQGNRPKVGFDKETMWTNEEYRLKFLEYNDRKEDAIPQCIKTRDGNWEGIPRLIQIGLDPKILDQQYVLDTQPWYSFEDDHWHPNEEFKQKYREKIVPILSRFCLIGQNIKYDLAFSALQFGFFPEHVVCTQLVAMLLNNGDNLLQDNTEAVYRLDALYNRYIPRYLFKQLTGKDFSEYYKFKKENQTADWSKELTDDNIVYGADDVKLIFFLFHYLMQACAEFTKKYPKSGLAKTIKIESEFTMETALMQSLGMGFDVDYQKNELVSYLMQKAWEQEVELAKIPECWIEGSSKLMCPKTNPHYVTLSHFIFTNKNELLKKSPEVVPTTSGDNLAKCLIDNLGYELPKTDSGKDSVAGEVLRELFWKSEPGKNRDILGRILQYKKAQSFLSKNGENQIKFVHSDGRCHPTYWQLAAETARLAATKPAVMTIPKRDKMFSDPILDPSGCPVKDAKGKIKTKDAFYLFGRAYKAREGYLIIDGDFSNEEVRVIGEYTGDREIIRAFQREEDLHQKTADNLGVDRYTGKLFFLASMYGAYERRIMEAIYDESGGEVDLPYAVCKELRAKHFDFYYGLRDAIAECEEYIQKQLAKYNSLTEFARRKPIMMEFTKNFGAHRGWYLNQAQERIATSILSGKYDRFHRNHKVVKKNKDGEEVLAPNGEPIMTTFGNDWNKTISAINRELFNYRIQGECSYILKTAVININRAFRREGYDPETEGVILTCHDEIASEVKEKNVEKAKEIQYHYMMEALGLVLKKIPPVVTLGVGRDLYEASPK